MTSALNIEVSAEPNAHVIQEDQEAIAIAKKLAVEFAKEDSVRDRNRRLPIEEVKKFSQSGLWGIIVPKEHSSAGVSDATLAKVLKIIAEADSSPEQIPQNHLYLVEAIKLNETDDQKHFGNAFSEINTKSVYNSQRHHHPKKCQSRNRACHASLSRF